MSSGTKLAIVVIFLLFVGTGVYFAFVAPPAADQRPTNPGVTPPVATPAPVRPRRAAPEMPAPQRDRVSPPPREEPQPRAITPVTPVIIDPPPAPESDAGAQPEPAIDPPAQSGGKEDEPEPSAPPPAPRPVQPTPEPESPRAPAPRLPEGAQTHVVASGDTMVLLAERYYGDRNKWQVIAKANPLVDPAAMRVGTQLVVPGAAAAAAVPPAPPAHPRPDGVVVHEVAAGETLVAIARKYYGNAGLWEPIYQANRRTIGDNPETLKVGMKLVVPPKPAA